MAQKIKIIHPDEREVEAASGAMTRLGGVSQSLCGAQGIHLGIGTIPPGGQSSPHWHTNCESAIYMLKGYGRILVDENLDEALPFGPGDFVYVPLNAVHAPVNDGEETVESIVARNAPIEIVEEHDQRPGAGLPSALSFYYSPVGC